MPCPEEGKQIRRTARLALGVLVLAQLVLAFQACLLPRSALAAVAATVRGDTMLPAAAQRPDAACHPNSQGGTANACLLALTQGDQTPLTLLSFLAPGQEPPSASAAMASVRVRGPALRSSLSGQRGHPPIPIVYCRLLN